MITLIMILSLFLDGLLSFYKGLSLFNIISIQTMFTITSIVLISRVYRKRYRDYYKMCLILGFVYDLLYTNALILNMLLFPLLGFITLKLYSFFQDNLINSLIINVIILLLHHLITFIILVIVGYLPFDLIALSSDIVSILIINNLYFIILYSILKRDKIKRGKLGYSL